MAAASTSSPSTEPVPTTVEMSHLDSANKTTGGQESMSENISKGPSAVAGSSSEPGASPATSNAILTQESNGQTSADEGISTNTPVAGEASTTPAPEPSESELQPNTDSITPGAAPSSNSSDVSGPVCIITLLLTSGARHPYKLDEKYLIKRNVNVPGTTESGKKDPFSISVYTLKELILREWREEWEVQPTSPSSIRLIHFGRLLDDKMPLKECRFNTDSPNVVHMTVKPQEVVDEEDASKGKAMGRDGAGSERTAGCRCTIM